MVENNAPQGRATSAQPSNVNRGRQQIQVRRAGKSMRLFVAVRVTKLKRMSSVEPNDPIPTEPVVVYTAALCTYCVAAKRLLQKSGVAYREIDLTHDHDLRERLSRENGDYRTVPMIFVEGRFIGGYTDLMVFAKEGGLARLA